MILRNHGLLTVGGTAVQALTRMASLRKACFVQLLAGQSRDLRLIDDRVIPLFAAEIAAGPAVDNPWPGLLRRLDRLDSSYKT